MYRRILARKYGVAIDPAFKMTIDTTQAGSASDTFILPLASGSIYNFDVDWGDGSSETITTDTDVTHVYPSSGTYQIAITGVFPKIFFNRTGDTLKLLSVDNWGIYGLDNIGNMTVNQSSAFARCNNNSSIANDVDNINLITNGFRMFEDNALSVLPENLTLNALIDGGNMFGGNSLESLPANMALSSLVLGSDIFGSGMFRFNNLESLPIVMTLGLLTNGREMFRGNSLATLPSNMKLQSLNNGVRMFENCTIDTVRYSQLLIDLESDNSNNNVNFSGGNSKYNTSGETARNILTSSPRNWTITDGGLI
jgi:hypothetical protein